MTDVAQLSDYRQQRKQLDVTDAMLEQIQFVADTDMSADDVVVFEATAVNTLPLNKAGSIFDQGRLTRSTLVAMAESVNSKNESVPLHTLHMQGDELPVGKVFHAFVNELADGQSELRAQFYLPRSSATLIEKVNLGILDEVSIGLKSEQLLCSKCGFDYFGDESDFENLWDRTCANGHSIGNDGTHAVLQGLDAWMELSLVSRGAATNAKIHGRAKRVMPQEQQDRIAASGYAPEAVTLFASPTKQKEEPFMKDKPEAQAAPAASEAEFDAQAAITELSTKIDGLVEALTAQADEPAVEAEAEATALDEANGKIETLTASIEELKTSIAALSKKTPADFAADLPEGGVSASAVTDAEKGSSLPSFASFKSRKS